MKYIITNDLKEFINYKEILFKDLHSIDVMFDVYKVARMLRKYLSEYLVSEGAIMEVYTTK
jgi:hypothetical protein